MNTKTLGIGIVLVCIVAAGFFLINSSRDQQPSTDIPINSGSTNNATADDKQVVDTVEEAEATSPSLIPYSSQALSDAEGKRKVLFFHASWCPTCQAAVKDFDENASKLPADVVVFQTDYDREDALKKKYAVTYQHTFVQIDDSGNEVTTWNGGGVDRLLDSVL